MNCNIIISEEFELEFHNKTLLKLLKNLRKKTERNIFKRNLLSMRNIVYIFIYMESPEFYYWIVFRYNL